MIAVNRFIPLLNYKRQIENQHKVDLYGRKLLFKVEIEKGRKANVEYAQEVIELRKEPELTEISIEVDFEEMGG